MKVAKINTRICAKPSFSGVKSPESKGIFAFDLDGTLAKGISESIKEVLKTVEQRNGVLVYATGRSKDEVELLQKELSEKGVDLPSPDFLVAEDGAVIYENVENSLQEIHKAENAPSKLYGIDFLAKKLDIKPKEILMAGDYLNDLSMTYLCHVGSSFICVGNACMNLKIAAHELASRGYSAYTATKDGSDGILEGFTKLLDKNA